MVRKVFGTSPASSPLGTLRAELSGAKSAWNAATLRVVRGYKKGYDEHVNALKKMKLLSTKQDQAFSSFIMSVLFIGFAGGVVGGLIAPWIKRSGDRVATNSLRGIFGWQNSSARIGLALKSGVQDAAKRVGQEAANWVTMPDPPKQVFSEYEPVVPDPLEVFLEKQEQVEIFFAIHDDYMDQLDDLAIQKQWPIEVGWEIADRFRRKCVILTDKPDVNKLPDVEGISKLAEKLMWIAWADARDWPYWDRQYEYLPRHNTGEHKEAREQFMLLDPALIRMYRIGIDREVSWEINLPTIKGTVLDLRKLRQLKAKPLPFPSMQSKVLSDLIGTPDVRRHEFLDTLRDLPPYPLKTSKRLA